MTRNNIPHFSTLSFYYYNILFDHYRNASTYGFLEISFVFFQLSLEKKRDKIPFHLAMELVYLHLNLWKDSIKGRVGVVRLKKKLCQIFRTKLLFFNIYYLNCIRFKFYSSPLALTNFSHSHTANP